MVTNTNTATPTNPIEVRRRSSSSTLNILCFDITETRCLILHKGLAHSHMWKCICNFLAIVMLANLFTLVTLNSRLAPLYRISNILCHVGTIQLLETQLPKFAQFYKFCKITLSKKIGNFAKLWVDPSGKSVWSAWTISVCGERGREAEHTRHVV